MFIFVTGMGLLHRFIYLTALVLLERITIESFGLPTFREMLCGFVGF